MDAAQTRGYVRKTVVVRSIATVGSLEVFYWAPAVAMEDGENEGFKALEFGAPFFFGEL